MQIPKTATPPVSEAPHLDSGSWTPLIESLGVAEILAALGSWIDTRTRLHCAAEDLWQDTLWLAWRDRAQHEWRGRRAFRAWLLGIARNRLANLRDRSRAAKRGGSMHRMALDVLRESGSSCGGWDIGPAESATPSRIASHAERAARIRAALRTLPPKLEPVVRLRLLEELPTREVARQLGIGVSTVKDRLLAGVKSYRRALRRELDTETAS